MHFYLGMFRVWYEMLAEAKHFLGSQAPSLWGEHATNLKGHFQRFELPCGLCAASYESDNFKIISAMIVRPCYWRLRFFGPLVLRYVLADAIRQSEFKRWNKAADVLEHFKKAELPYMYLPNVINII